MPSFTGTELDEDFHSDFQRMYDDMRQQARDWAEKYGEGEVKADMPSMSQTTSVRDSLLKVASGECGIELNCCYTVER